MCMHIYLFTLLCTYIYIYITIHIYIYIYIYNVGNRSVPFELSRLESAGLRDPCLMRRSITGRDVMRWHTWSCETIRRAAPRREAKRSEAKRSNASQSEATQRIASQRIATQSNATPRHATPRNATQRDASRPVPSCPVPSGPVPSRPLPSFPVDVPGCSLFEWRYPTDCHLSRGCSDWSFQQQRSPYIGWRYLSNATCLMRPRWFYALGIVSTSTIYDTVLVTSEEHMRSTSSVRQAAPPEQYMICYFAHGGEYQHI